MDLLYWKLTTNPNEFGFESHKSDGIFEHATGSTSTAGTAAKPVPSPAAQSSESIARGSPIQDVRILVPHYI